jgi:error-prone DNA polymerase
MLSCKEANETENLRVICVAGKVINRQRPGTAKGVCFITLEDETGYCNLVVFPKIFEKFRSEIGGLILGVKGRVERTEVVHIIVSECYLLTGLMGGLADNTEARLGTPVSSDDKSGLYIPDEARTGIKPKDYIDKGRNYR